MNRRCNGNYSNEWSRHTPLSRANSQDRSEEELARQRRLRQTRRQPRLAVPRCHLDRRSRKSGPPGEAVPGQEVHPNNDYFLILRSRISGQVQHSVKAVCQSGQYQHIRPGKKLFVFEWPTGQFGVTAHVTQFTREGARQIDRSNCLGNLESALKRPV